MTKQRLVTSAEVALIANVSQRTVGRWVEAGRLPVVQQLPGKTGARLFDEAQVRKTLTFVTKAVA